jgi:hypothetical protein
MVLFPDTKSRTNSSWHIRADGIFLLTFATSIVAIEYCDCVLFISPNIICFYPSHGFPVKDLKSVSTTIQNGTRDLLAG